MLLFKRISSVVLAGILSVLCLTGCKQTDVNENDETNDNNIQIEEHVYELDVETLEFEYMQINDLVDHIMTVIATSDQIGVSEAIDLIKYVQQNKIEPTQLLTTEYNDLLNELMDLGIKYVMSSGDKKLEIEDEILSLIRQIDDIKMEIEETINNYGVL